MADAFTTRPTGGGGRGGSRRWGAGVVSGWWGGVGRGREREKLTKYNVQHVQQMAKVGLAHIPADKKKYKL